MNGIVADLHELLARIGQTDLRQALRSPEHRARLREHVLRAAESGPETAQEPAQEISRLLQSKRPGIKKFQEQLERLRVALAGQELRPFVNPPACALIEDAQLLAEFLVEGKEHLDSIEAGALALEQAPGEMEAIHSVFRGFHTLKGLAGFLELHTMQEVAHEIETVLDLARNGTLRLDRERIEVILQAGDYLRTWISHIEQVQQGISSPEPGSPDRLIGRIRQAVDSTAAPDTEAAEADSPAAVENEVQPRRASESSVIKVDSARLEYLIDMVGELVIAQSMLRHNPELAAPSPRLQRDLAQLSRVTNEVQKTAMAMRMVPIGTLFRKMTRLVRDLSRKSGKLAELELSGEDVQLDRTIVEQLADPMVHMLRNSLDHGVETPDEREAAGKPKAGKVKLKASHQAGQIAIEIIDDGRGLNRQAILEKALSLGLVKPSQSLTDGEIHQLIFSPGFSTAKQVTDVSGRGVGMDVVRRNIEKLRGSIAIESKPGEGTRFLLRFPLTLAIIDGLIVVAGGERYIVPLFAVREVIRPSREMLFTVEHRAEMALVRERLMPVIRLARRLGTEERSADLCDGLLIVSELGGKHFCFSVDGLLGKQEVVIKGLGPVFSGVRGVAGGAILGDGRVGLILDVSSLIEDLD